MKEENKVYFDLEHKPLRSEREEIKARRKKKILSFFSYLFVLASGIVIGYFLVSSFHPQYRTNISNTIGEIEYMMKNVWLYGNEKEDLIEELENKALYGMTNYEDDPYTEYMSKKEMMDFAQSINRDYVGIGVQYSSQTGKAIITRVFKDSPAEKAGLLAGDIIDLVDGVKVDESNVENLKEIVTGESGSEVKIGVLRGSESIEYTVIRQAINATAYATLEDDYVYLRIESFGDTTSAEIESYLEGHEDFDRIIIDLRDNGGGYQTSVRDCLRLFIGPNRPYLKQSDQKGNEQVDYTISGKTFENFDKIVILVNNDTASAAEVFALVMKEEADNVTLVGKTTFGKGVIQTNKYLSNGGVLKITSYYWYSPKGTSIHKVGLKPDIEVNMPEIYYEHYDPVGIDKEYETDSVSEAVRLCEIALDYLDYEVDRFDGYFDESFALALRAFKNDNNLEENMILDNETYNAIISRVRYEISANDEKDLQLMKAIEVLHED